MLRLPRNRAGRPAPSRFHQAASHGHVDALAELQAVGCAFVSLRDNLDLTTPLSIVAAN